MKSICVVCRNAIQGKSESANELTYSRIIVPLLAARNFVSSYATLDHVNALVELGSVEAEVVVANLAILAVLKELIAELVVTFARTHAPIPSAAHRVQAGVHCSALNLFFQASFTTSCSK
jgi:hypothetical protein